MILSLYSGLALVAWALARITAAHAPVGYEDKSGFHYGPRSQQAESQQFAAPAGVIAQPA